MTILKLDTKLPNETEFRTPLKKISYCHAIHILKTDFTELK